MFKGDRETAHYGRWPATALALHRVAMDLCVFGSDALSYQQVTLHVLAVQGAGIDGNLQP